MPLELDHLRESCETLAELLEVSNDWDRMEWDRMEQLGEVVEKGIRAGIVQYFELTFELTRALVEQTIQEQLQLDEINLKYEIIKSKKINFAYLMREAANAGLIHDPAAYINYRNIRNRTTHTYDCELTEEAVAAMPEFLESVRFLIEELTRRNS